MASSRASKSKISGMTAERWLRIKDVFASAMECEASAREAFLEQATGGDLELAAEVRRLIAESERESGLLSQPVVALGVRIPVTNAPRFPDSTVLARRF